MPTFLSSDATIGPLALLWTAAALVGLSGCGDNRPKTYPVQGRVEFTSRQPVPVGVVEFRLKSTGEKAHGKLDANGRFSLKSSGKRVGTLPGEHQVIVIQHFDPRVLKTGEKPASTTTFEGEPHDHEHEPPMVHRRYASYTSTPLSAVVKPQPINEVVLKVESASRRTEE